MRIHVVHGHTVHGRAVHGAVGKTMAVPPMVHALICHAVARRAITSVGLHVPHAAATNGIARVIIITTTYRPVITQQAAHQRPEPARHNVPPAHTVQTAKKTTATVAIHPPPVRPPEHNAIVHAASPAPNRHVRQTQRARTAPRQHRARNIMGARAMHRHQLVPLQ